MMAENMGIDFDDPRIQDLLKRSYDSYSRGDMTIDSNGEITFNKEESDVLADENIIENVNLDDAKEANKTHEDHYNDIANHRKDKGLPEYKLEDPSTGTCAKIDVNGKDYFGLNSSLSPEAKDLRQKWFDKIDWVNSKKGKKPAHIGHTQSLSHAEALSLMNAFEAEGSLPKEITMYVDRPTCPFCISELPILLKTMGVDKLIVYSGSKQTPKIIEAEK
jgi:hypothetical protein